MVIVNPSTPIGALDYKPTPTGRMIVDFLNRRMPAYVDTGLNLVGVEDCAQGHLLAAERGRIGEKYILGGENLTLAELFARLAEMVGTAGAADAASRTRSHTDSRSAPRRSRARSHINRRARA